MANISLHLFPLYVKMLMYREEDMMAEALIGNHVIHYEIMGVRDFKLRTPALMLHGNGESMGIFDGVMAPLLSSRGFVLMDSRYQGESHPVDENEPPEIHYELMASDGMELMENVLGITEYDIIGYSDGAVIALLMAMRSIKVRRLVLIGVNADPEGLKPRAIRSIQKEKKLAEQEGEALKTELCRLMLEEPNITRDMLAGIICETTVFIGKNDEFIRREHSQSIADAIPRGSHTVINGAGHDILSERPGELSDYIRSLL